VSPQRAAVSLPPTPLLCVRSRRCCRARDGRRSACAYVYCVSQRCCAFVLRASPSHAAPTLLCMRLSARSPLLPLSLSPSLPLAARSVVGMFLATAVSCCDTSLHRLRAVDRRCSHSGADACPTVAAKVEPRGLPGRLRPQNRLGVYVERRGLCRCGRVAAHRLPWLRVRVCVSVCLCLSLCLRASVWVSGCLDVWASGCLGVWVSGCLGVWVSGCLGVWVSGCLGV
jgi:hypothetical protein